MIEEKMEEKATLDYVRKASLRSKKEGGDQNISSVRHERGVMNSCISGSSYVRGAHAQRHLSEINVIECDRHLQ